MDNEQLKKYIDQHKEAMDTHQPGAHLWDNIEEELHPEKKRRGIIWWGGIAAGVAVAIGMYFMFPGEDKTQTASTHGWNVNDPANGCFEVVEFEEEKVDSQSQLELEKVVTPKNEEDELTKRRHYKHSQNIDFLDGDFSSAVYYEDVQGNESEKPLVVQGTNAQGSEQAIVTDNETGEVVGVYKPNKKTGKYLFQLPPGKDYIVTYDASASGYLYKSSNLIVPTPSKKQGVNTTIQTDATLDGIYIPKKTPTDEIFNLKPNVDIGEIIALEQEREKLAKASVKKEEAERVNYNERNLQAKRAELQAKKAELEKRRARIQSQSEKRRKADSKEFKKELALLEKQIKSKQEIAQLKEKALKREVELQKKYRKKVKPKDKKKVDELAKVDLILDGFKDTDGDGVVDSYDKDSKSPEGAKTYGDGIALDSDKDGVPDYLDQERYSPSTNVDENGVEIKNREQYDEIVENEFISPFDEPQSTFSIDVDAAGYSNVRRFINSDQLPRRDAVKLEEMINYFDYDYKEPTDEHPFSFTTEIGACPWNAKHKLVHIGLQGRSIEKKDVPASNLVFLIDVSGSMQSKDKLELLKKGFRLLTGELRAEDKVSIVVYAGAAGLVLPPTNGNKTDKIVAAIDRLTAGGSTAGGEGIDLAYKVAMSNFKKNGNNRVILATDGDFNVGVSEDKKLTKMIEQKRKTGVFLTVLGFGTGNFQASKMEKLADNGNGNFAYIDNSMEAKKVMVNEFGAMYTIAKDVKLQVEFNPAKVKGYRLIGYENRVMAAQDFNDDTKDAGELGAGHTVTALYEIIPANSEEEIQKADSTRYFTTKTSGSSEFMQIKFRYKNPKEDKSILMTHVVNEDETELSKNFHWSASVAELGLLLRDSKYKGSASFDSAFQNGKKGMNDDKHGYRHEFMSLIKKAESLSK